MEEKKQILQRLLEEGSWTDEDSKWFLEYLDTNDTSALQELMQKAFTEDVASKANTIDDNARKILGLIHQKIQTDNQPAKVIRLSLWKKLAAAAVIIFLLGTGAYVLFVGNQKKEIAKTENKNVPDDIMPGKNNATLTLANGVKIILDSAHTGALATQGNVQISKLGDGQLAYSSSTEKHAEVVFNTISTPRGGQYQLTLSDGTKVWLNAASSLRYPASFSGKDRKVELTGEAYFEVAHNAAMPFKVNVADKEEVEVLGTHFNINSYNDEPLMKTTLLEGSVKLSHKLNATTDAQQAIILKPGEQGWVLASGKMNKQSNADIGKVMAWKNNIFNFNNENIESIMRQLSRWYDVDIRFEGKIPGIKFSGEIGRNLSLKQVLGILDETRIKYKLEGKTLTIIS